RSDMEPPSNGRVARRGTRQETRRTRTPSATRTPNENSRCSRSAEAVPGLVARSCIRLRSRAGGAERRAARAPSRRFLVAAFLRCYRAACAVRARRSLPKMRPILARHGHVAAIVAGSCALALALGHRVEGGRDRNAALARALVAKGIFASADDVRWVDAPGGLLGG